MNTASFEPPRKVAVNECPVDRNRTSGDGAPSNGCEAIREILRCPACGSGVESDSDALVCVNPRCAIRFPVVNGVPVLVNDQQSLFARADYSSRQDSSFNATRTNWVSWLDRLLPDLSWNIAAARNYDVLAELLCKRAEKPLVLVVGGRVLGSGMQQLAANTKIRMVETDVSFGPRTQLICDAHDLPFDNNSVDCVIVQAVLSYVTDPCRCVRQIERVLKPDGFVYAETAFMQQVVHGRYDFTRYSHLGLRRLFRAFEEVDSGPACGPGMALAWAGQFFLLSLSNSRWARRAAYAFARLTLFWLKYFDVALKNKRGTYDAASGFYFLGQKTGCILSDRELIALYRGAQ